MMAGDVPERHERHDVLRGLAGTEGVRRGGLRRHRQHIPGAVLGGLLIGLTENLVVWMGYPGYKDAVAFIVLIAVLMFRPGGLLGSNKVEKV